MMLLPQKSKQKMMLLRPHKMISMWDILNTYKNSWSRKAGLMISLH